MTTRGCSIIVTIAPNGNAILVRSPRGVGIDSIHEVTDYVSLVTTIERERQFTGIDRVLCSSTIDFPEDETSNKEIIDACRRFRGGC